MTAGGKGADWYVKSGHECAIGLIGGTGFVGGAVAARLQARGLSVRSIARRPATPGHPEGDVAGVAAQLAPLLAGCTTIINCAGRAHIQREVDAAASRRLFMAVNRDLAEAIAVAAKAAGLSRMVQVSSVAAIASASGAGERITDLSPPAPTTTYGESKLAGDGRVLALADDAFRPVVLRPPAVFGPGARGWFPLFLSAARYGLPLPLGKIENERSFAYVGNIADAICEASLGNYTGAFIVTDSQPISSGRFYHLLAKAAGHDNRVWPIPARPTSWIAKAVLGERASSLLEDAAFDGARFIETSNWKPSWNLQQAVERTIAGADA